MAIADGSPRFGLAQLPAFIPPPDAVKLEIIVNPVGAGKRARHAGTIPSVAVEPKALNQVMATPIFEAMFPAGIQISRTVRYFKRGTLVTLSTYETPCWFFGNWDTTAPFEVVPRRPTIGELYLTKMQLRLDRDAKVTAYFGQTVVQDPRNSYKLQQCFIETARVPTPTPSSVPSPIPTVRPPATATPTFIPPPGSVKLVVVVHPVDTKGRGEDPAHTGFWFSVPLVSVEPRALNFVPATNKLSLPPMMYTDVLYFKRGTLVTLSAWENPCWFIGNWDTTTPFEIIPRQPTIDDLYRTRIQMRLDRDTKITAYFGKTADYDPRRCYKGG